ncbi:MAG: hypothetical protein VXZ96_00010 [Myxococcota bacterium]|nr:hypothetical protein [Myxococcota bacterium]
MWFFLISCITKTYHGLLTLKDDSPHLVDIKGHEYRLHLGEDSPFFSNLDGVVVRIKGPKILKHVYVNDWTVVDAGDGSAPFIGVLYRQGVQWMMNDIQSGSQLVLDGDFADWNIDDVVMIVGYVAGSHRIQVISYRHLGQLKE